jgi:HSP20 family protein
VTKKKLAESRALSSFEQSMSNLQNAVNRLFDDAWLRLPSFFNPTILDTRAGSDWWPKVDISDTDKAINIKMNVPGVDPKNINIEADANTLTISGHTEKEDEEQGENWYRVERESGAFRRSFDLPSGCDVDNISASAKHGTLYITIPKKPEAQKKKIDINVQS